MKRAKKILMIIGIIIGIILIWGFIEPYLIDVEEQEASIPNLPESWENEKIAVIGDFQVGMWGDNASVIPRVVDRLIKMEPRAVLLTGDYVYHAVGNRPIERNKVVDMFRPLVEADIPVFAVLGNHDYAMASKTDDPNREEAERVATLLEEAGIEVLKNESIPLTMSEDGVQTGTASADSLHLIGLGSSWANNVDVEQALTGVPDDAPRMVLMHNPNAFASMPADSAPAAVAGHTHGGQIRIPFLPQWSYKDLLANGEAHVDGWAAEDYGAAGNQLYVNRGIGLSVFPMRLNCLPEITVFELRSQ